MHFSVSFSAIPELVKLLECLFGVEDLGGARAGVLRANLCEVELSHDWHLALMLSSPLRDFTVSEVSP